jgi:hypothetical protein
VSKTHLFLLGGLILTVTGVIALVHYSLRTSGRLPEFLRNDTLSPRAELIVAIVLVVVGAPLLLMAFTSG